MIETPVQIAARLTLVVVLVASLACAVGVTAGPALVIIPVLLAGSLVAACLALGRQVRSIV